MRQYDAARLNAGEALEAGSRYASYFRGLAEDAAPEIHGPWQLELLARLEMEHDNLRVALQWGLDSDDIALSQRTEASLYWF